MFIETGSGWRCESAPEADFDWCLRFAKLVANFTRQRVDATAPLLSASLPGGERVQIVLPPATTRGMYRDQHSAAGERTVVDRRAGAARDFPQRAARRCRLRRDSRRSYCGCWRADQFEASCAWRCVSRKNILVSGPTGSGKTTWTKALIREIPADERLITIEDAQELVLDRHPNHVRLFYSKDDQGVARVTPKQLLESCLRMKPDRILLAELRAEEAFDYLRNVNSGHPGSITSVHASSASWPSSSWCCW